MSHRTVNRQKVTERFEEVMRDNGGNSLAVILETVDRTWRRVRLEYRMEQGVVDGATRYFCSGDVKHDAWSYFLELKVAARDLGWT